MNPPASTVTRRLLFSGLHLLRQLVNTTGEHGGTRMMIAWQAGVGLANFGKEFALM